ncbi:hypothetical protein ACEN2J_18880 [Pseudorhodobacter sp. W20_MBD10_FR17]|uniref:hypothetical protein n=1 Tax=Pseudorhodobacter sp. W20_MBD10_FR17 TaxID=3240266 RepID=UPI003F99E2FE
MKRVFALLPIAFTLACQPAFAGPVAEFDAAFDGMYASYRVALFATNSGNAEKSAAAMAGMEQQWQGLLASYGQTPPPQYEDDTLWPDMTAEVSKTLAKAQDEVTSGDLAASHLTLEAVRESFSALHARNGIERFSDRMNAYHAEMEHVLELDLTVLDAAAMQRVLEHAVVLDYLAQDIAVLPPAGTEGDAEYNSLSSAMLASVDALLTAARAADEAAVKAAIGGLKVPYSKLFLKFG